MKYISIFALAFAVANADSKPEISIFDSRTMPGESYLLLDDCFVALKTKKITDDCYLQNEIAKQCGIKDIMGVKCDKK